MLFDKIASVYILFEKYIYILALEMASPGNQHCANCIGTLSFPINWIQSSANLYAMSVRCGQRRKPAIWGVNYHLVFLTITVTFSARIINVLTRSAMPWPPHVTAHLLRYGWVTVEARWYRLQFSFRVVHCLHLVVCYKVLLVCLFSLTPLLLVYQHWTPYCGNEY